MHGGVGLLLTDSLDYDSARSGKLGGFYLEQVLLCNDYYPRLEVRLNIAERTQL